MVAWLLVWPPVLPLQPKYKAAHPENYLFSLSEKVFPGSKYPKNKLFDFEKGSTGGHTKAKEVSSSKNEVTTAQARGWGSGRAVTHPDQGQLAVQQGRLTTIRFAKGECLGQRGAVSQTSLTSSEVFLAETSLMSP